jgi:hypothetical protein
VGQLVERLLLTLTVVYQTVENAQAKERPFRKQAF